MHGLIQTLGLVVGVVLTLSCCVGAAQMLGSKDKRYVCLGPASGFADHYGALLARAVVALDSRVALVHVTAAHHICLLAAQGMTNWTLYIMWSLHTLSHSNERCASSP